MIGEKLSRMICKFLELDFYIEAIYNLVKCEGGKSTEGYLASFKDADMIYYGTRGSLSPSK